MTKVEIAAISLNLHIYGHVSFRIFKIITKYKGYSCNFIWVTSQISHHINIQGVTIRTSILRHKPNVSIFTTCICFNSYDSFWNLNDIRHLKETETDRPTYRISLPKRKVKNNLYICWIFGTRRCGLSIPASFGFAGCCLAYLRFETIVWLCSWST